MKTNTLPFENRVYLIIDVMTNLYHIYIVKGQMNQNFDIWSLVSLKQLNTKTDHYKVYSPNNFAS